MWDSNAPLQLLKSMPEKLEDEHLEKLQLLFEADKYKEQLLNGVDSSGSYSFAPFCRNCNKQEKYPCAVAYVNAMNEAGLNTEMPSYVEQTEDLAENKPDFESEKEAVDETTENVASDLNKEKIKIRIAVARKKTL